jgi:hypothetical protein
MKINSEHAPLLRWFWRTDDDEAALRRDIEAIRAAGYGGLVLWPPHAAPGYLGSEWMRRTRFVAQECHAQNLQLWLCDDWTQPSGSGELARAQSGDVPGDYAAWSLRFETQNLSREAALSWTPPYETPLAAWAAPLENKITRWNESLDLLPLWDKAKQTVASLGEAAQIVLFFATRDTRDLDRLHPGTARLLLETTHEKYREHLEEFFGETVRGFLSSGPPLPQNAPDELPWSPHLGKEFATQHGYDLMARLPSLIAATGDDAVMVRQHFWETIAAQLERHWWTPVRAWCENHNLQLALWPHLANESFNSAVRAYGDLSTALRGGHSLFIAAQDSTLVGRLAASIASLENQAPPLAIWLQSAAEVAPQERTGVQQRLWQQGIGSALSAPDEPLQPYAALIESINEEIAQRATWLAQTRPAGRVGVLLAMRSAWAHYHPKGHRFTRWVWEDYLTVTQMLDELHFDFFVLPENDFLSAPIHAGQLLCGRAQLCVDVLIVPGATTLPTAAWRKIEAFVADGGKVVCLGLLPRWSEIGRDEELENHISQTTLLTVADLYSQNQPNLWSTEESSTGFPITRQNERGGRLACYQPSSNPDRDDALLRVRQMLKDSLPAGLETQAKNLIFSRREEERSTLFYLANRGVAQLAHVRLRAAREAAFELFEIDAQGSAHPRPVWMEFSADEGGGISLEVPLGAGQCRFLQARYCDKTPVHLEKTTFTVEAFDGNVVTGFSTSGGTPRAIINHGDKLHSFAGESVVVPTPILLDDEWLCHRLSPNMLPLETSLFQVDSPPSTLWVRAPGGVAVWLNGEPLSQITAPFGNDTLWGAAAAAWFEAAPLRVGENYLDSVPNARLQLIGNFEISESGTLEAAHDFMLSSGSWHEQGLPFYSGAVVYTQKVNIPAEWANCRVWLELSRLREAILIEINEVFCGTALHGPFRFEVTEALRPGAANGVSLFLYNSALPHSGEQPEAGLLGPVRLVAYPKVEIALP